MHRRKLLKGLLALPVSGVLQGCQAEDKDKRGESGKSSRPVPGILQVVLNGGFAIVIQKNIRNRIRVFSPADPRHRFYFNNLEKSQQDIIQRKSYNFELLPDGLDPRQGDLHVRQELRDFNVRTDQWCMGNDFITIDLPAPEEIGFLPPLKIVRFKASGKDAQIAGAHVLKYRVADMNRVRMVLFDGGDDFRPLSCGELIERYKRACSTMKDGANHGSCADMVKRYPQVCPEGSHAFFFGIGLPSGESDNGHALQFFNERILAAFPKLKAQLELQPVGEPHPYRTGSVHAEVIPAVFNPEVDQARLRQVSAVLDCNYAGPIVTHPAGGGG
jgi:hypothetical protein